LNGKLTTVTKPSGFATSHTIAIDPDNVIPGQNYTYVVVSTNKKGVTTTSVKKTLTTKGLTVSIGVFDKNHKPVAKKEVTLHSVAITSETDKDGYATFNNVTPGTHHLTYVDGDKSYDSEVVVANNVKTANGVQTAATQTLSVVYGFEQSSGMSPMPWVIGLLLLAVGGVVVYFVKRRRAMVMPVAGAVAPTIVTSSDNPPVIQPTEAAKPVNNVPYPSAPQPGSTVAPGNDEAKKE